jgi:DNA-directed RNA polymerase specialized sigma24 family protein
MGKQDIHPVFGDLRKIRKTMLAFAARHGCGNESEDYVQTALEEMLKQQSKFADEGKTERAARWGCTILRFCIYNGRAKYRNDAKRLDDFLRAEMAMQPSDSSYQAVLLADTLAYLAHAFTDKQRNLLLLSAFGGAPDEIARVCGCSRDVARAYPGQVRRRLREWAAA